MKAEILTWTLLQKMPHEGRQVLHDGGLITVRKIGTDISTIAGSKAKFYVDYTTPWSSFRTMIVRGEFMVAVIESGPDTKEQG